MSRGSGQGKAGAIARFRAAEHMTDGQAREGEDRDGAERRQSDRKDGGKVQYQKAQEHLDTPHG
jgi:hypothetical protein